MGGSSEDRVDKLRIIVFAVGASGNNPVLYLNKLYQGTELSGVYKMLIPIGYVKFYVVANEDDSWALSSVATVADVENKTFNWSPNRVPTSPFAMYGFTSSVVPINRNVSRSVAVPVERINARVRLYLNCVYGTDEIYAPLKIDSIRVLCQPKRPKIGAVTYNSNNNDDFYYTFGVKCAPSIAQSWLTYNGNGFVSAGSDNPIVFYIPENKMAYRGMATFLQIYGAYYLGAATVWNDRVADVSAWQPTSYVINIGDGVQNYYSGSRTFESLSLTELSVTRNVTYDISAHIRSLGDKNLNTIIVDAQPWDDVSLKGEFVNPFVVFNASVTDTTLSLGGQLSLNVWSNQPNVYLDNQLYNASGVALVSQTLSTIFSVYPTSPVALTQGYAKLNFTVKSSASLGVYIIKLKSGTQQRRLKITLK